MQSLARCKFPEIFSLTVNGKHFSNRVEAAKFFDEIIVPYVKKERESKSWSSDQKALVSFYVFKGQMTKEALEILTKILILVTTVPASIIKYYQPLDLKVNGYEKRFLAKHFNEWYTARISKQLEDGKDLEEIKVIRPLSV